MLYNKPAMTAFDKTPLYQQIAESVRQEIVYGQLAPGDALPSVRTMADRWQCTPGTVQQAYRELVRHGLVVSRPGQGSRVAAALRSETPLRRASLVHQAEAFLLDTLAAGYTVVEVERALRIALDRWRALATEPSAEPSTVLRFAGSHDPAVSLIASRFGDIVPGAAVHVTFSGSLGGLIALASGEADLAGSHLWDETRDCYNAPFVERLLPGRRVALLTLAHRCLGLLVPSGNPAGIAGIVDLGRAGLRFANRQRGAGTRVWLDAQLRRAGIEGRKILGYDHEALTHSEVARLVAEGQADAGLGVETVALDYGLGFIPLATERYDLVMLAETWQAPPVQQLAGWLTSAEGQAAIADLGGYDTRDSGSLAWVAS